jgi:hypothetical protein
MSGGRLIAEPRILGWQLRCRKHDYRAVKRTRFIAWNKRRVSRQVLSVSENSRNDPLIDFSQRMATDQRVRL